MTSTLLAEIEAKVRAIHYYGNPPDARLQEDVDADVEDILASVRRVVADAGLSVSQPETRKGV